MEIVAIVFMLVGGGAIAVFVMVAMAVASRARENEAAATPRLDSVAASLLVHIVVSGGVGAEDAMRNVRRGTGIAAPVTTGIDVANWAKRYAQHTTPQQRSSLLEMAVQLVASRGRTVPLRQYAALLDLSFGLGFQTDALARLRELYGFEYVDHAKDARPSSADRKGGGASLAVRLPRERDELLALLGVQGSASRQEISAAYRKLVTKHHPDRFFSAPADEQNAAAARFIEITRAYEELLRRM